MDSTDEKIFKKQQLIREAEAREQTKRAQKELARKKFEQMQTGQGPDKMQSMSSADFQPKQETPSSSSSSYTATSKVSNTQSTIFNSVTDAPVQELGGSRGDRPKKAMVLGKANQAKKLPNSLTFE